MATPSNGGDSDKAIPQSLPPPSSMESWASLPQEGIVDHAIETASLDHAIKIAWLEKLLLEDIVDQSPCSKLLFREHRHGYRSDAYRSDASDTSGPTDFSGASSFTGEGEMEEGHLRNPRGERGNKKTTGARIEMSWDDILGSSEDDILGLEQMCLQEAEEVETRSEGRGEGEMEEEHLNSTGCLFKGKKKVRSPRGERENKETTGGREGEMEEGHLNSTGCLFKGKRKVRSPRGERGNKKTTGARIEISLDDILQVEQMRLREAARHLKVSASTLKRACREHGIHRWPPRMGRNCFNQSGPSESLLAVDQEGIAQQRPDTPRSDTPSSSYTNSVIIKARYVNDCTIKFRLSRPWVMVELEQQVQKRLKLEAGTYYIKYKDEDNDLIIIACDEDLQDYISSSRPRGTTSIEVLLVPK